MLKGIDPVLTGEALHALNDMGHGDIYALVDRNYPAHSSGQLVIHLGDIGAERAIRAILSVVPLDTFVSNPLERMVSDSQDPEHEVHDAVMRVAQDAHGSPLTFGLIARTDFYSQARNSQVIFQCLETTPYSCFILTKGVV